MAHNIIIENGAYPSPLNYYKFPKSICTSVNEVICHGIPDQRELIDGDILNVDISVYLNNMHADLNETFPIGNVDKESINLMKTSYNCLMKAIEICKPGVLYRDVGGVIESYVKNNGCSVNRT